MKLAVWDGVFEGMEPEQALDIALRLDFQGVQVQWWNLHALTEKAKTKLARKISRAGLKVAAVNLGQDCIPFVRINFSSELFRIKEELDHAADSCAVLGAENMIVRGMRRFEGEKDDDRIWTRTRDHFLYLSERLQSLGIRLLIEQFPTPPSWLPSLIPDSNHALKMSKELSGEKAGFAFDSGHAIMTGEDPLDILKNHLRKIEYLLLNDNRIHPFVEKNSPYCGIDSHLPLTRGIMTKDKILRIMSGLRDSAFQGWICLNICAEKQNALEVFHKNKNLLT